MTEAGLDLEASYDRVAKQYAQEFFGELDRKPFDRERLDEFAASILSGEHVCEIGCGPGHISRYLQGRGVNMFGIDLSLEMIRQARELNPGIEFDQGDMLALDAPDSSWGGIVCFYAIIHIRREDVIRALREMHRVLRPGGKLLLSYHGGTGELHREEWYNEPVSINVTLLEKDEMAGYLEVAGFELKRTEERGPYDFEYPTRRIYAFAQKP